ncbi:uncharacterized protein LOC121367367 [Gigantopelta aegis]|uniref:uncharacterized protein LOC121367367 n=1 Tax=Gigantopelta aegis TaxID=1735272 RepID=UPI001B88DE48|nr:uncharacterized protein LOC121367367 [Gigantopelta aegis]
MSFTTSVYLFAIGAICGSVLILRREVGFVYKNGKPEAEMKIDLFVDLFCPKSKALFSRLMEVVDGYRDDQIRLKTHLVPLPYHAFSFMASKTVHSVSTLTRDQQTYNWMAAIFSNMSLFRENAHSKTQHDVMTQFTDMVETFKVDKDDFTQLCCSDLHVEDDTRVGWKYSCSRGVHSVPWFMINDMTVNAEEWTVQDWKKQIDKLLGSQ